MSTSPPRTADEIAVLVLSATTLCWLTLVGSPDGHGRVSSRQWLPQVLAGKSILGYFKFLPDQATIVEQALRTTTDAELAAVVAHQAALPAHRPPSLGLSQREAAAAASSE